MKNLLVFLLGAVVGALGFWYYTHGEIRHITPVPVVDKAQPAPEKPEPQQSQPAPKTHHSATSSATTHTASHSSTQPAAHVEQPTPKHEPATPPSVATKTPETSAALTSVTPLASSPTPQPDAPPSVTFVVPTKPLTEPPATVVSATVAPAAPEISQSAPIPAAMTAEAKPINTQATELIDKVSENAVAMAGTIKNKLVEWNLTPADIKKDLASAGTVVREKSKAAGEAISSTVTNARIITVIKTKYALDRDLSKETVRVDCNEGAVTLSGSVSSLVLIGRAMALALDTDGVNGVTSQLTLASASPSAQ